MWSILTCLPATTITFTESVEQVGQRWKVKRWRLWRKVKSIDIKDCPGGLNANRDFFVHLLSRVIQGLLICPFHIFHRSASAESSFHWCGLRNLRRHRSWRRANFGRTAGIWIPVPGYSPALAILPEKSWCLLELRNKSARLRTSPELRNRFISLNDIFVYLPDTCLYVFYDFCLFADFFLI